MDSNPSSEAYFQTEKGYKPRDPNMANQPRDQRSPHLEANPDLQQQQPPHQPMYRKREPGQKEKRVLKKTPNSPSPRKKHGTSAKDRSAAPKKDNAKPNPSNKTNQTKNNPKKKTKKQNNKAKKKKSSLAFWFCMSSNNDTQDRSSQAPVPKSPKPKPSIEQQKQDTLDRDTTITPEMPTEILATKYSRRHAGKRHSAPASSEWTRIVTTAIVESPSQPPRSRTPTGGVRYRYDGTLERPYVYPGGLTFQSGGDKSWRHDAKRLEGRGNISSSFCDTTMEDVPCDKYDDFDITSKIYLRFDDDLGGSSNSKDRRMSMPSDLSVREHRQLGHRLPSPALDTVPDPPFTVSRQEDDNSPQNQNVIYDIPYESDSDKDSENEAEDEQTDGKRNSYYSKPLQNSGCIYMWHSCEDLQHCEEKYHSKDGINRVCLNCNGNTPPRCHKDIHTGYGNGGDHISISSSPTAGPDTNVIGDARKMSLPVGLTLEYPFSDSAQTVTDSGQQATLTSNDTPRNGDTKGEVNANEATPGTHYSDPSQGMSTQRESPKLPDQSKQTDSPFRRDIGRSSCMPGNKRFFLPPPPCYTPPKEEMEVTLATISKINCHRGSQTDLTEDIDQVDMEDRDLSLKRQEPERQDAMISQMARFSLDAETSTTVVTEKNTVQDKRRNFEFEEEIMSKSPIANETSNNTQSNLTKSEPNQKTEPTATVRTSTPKPIRRSEGQGEDLKIFSGPKPLPRKRIPSKDSNPSFSTPKEDLVQPTKIDSGNQPVDSLPNMVVVRTNKIPPVPKKRRSQMTDADLSYTFADIEKVLAECKDSLPRGIQAPKDTPVNNDGLRQDSLDTQIAEERQKSESNVYGRGSGRSKPSSLQVQTTPSKNQTQVNASPEGRACRLNSSLGSSIDGGYPSRKFSALSPSLDNMAHVLPERTFDPDNEDNCNADDEMSIHNEDVFPTGSASVQNLLRSRSIFDRSLAVTRKRRQRLRDRKCHSQLLSSADLDEYDKKMARNHLWKLQKCDGHERRVPGFLLTDNSGKHVLLKPQLLMEKNLWKHSYTDSGNDSDMVSPIDTRFHQQVEDVFRESSYPPPEMWKKTGTCDYVKDTREKKPWELRLKVKHELRKARSIEHLFLAQDARATKKPSLETCV